jgi:hypothetical protein
MAEGRIHVVQLLLYNGSNSPSTVISLERMMQTVTGSVFIGGLIVFSILSLILPIFVEVQKSLQRVGSGYLRQKLILPMLLVTGSIALLWLFLGWL